MWCDRLDSLRGARHHHHPVREEVHPVYRWRDLRFAPPVGLHDDTLLTFSAPDGGWNLTVARDALTGPLAAYARAQEQTLAARRPAGYKTSPPREEVANGRKTVVVDRTLHDPRGKPLTQRQVFVGAGVDVVVIVTVTATGASVERAHAAALALVTSLEIPETRGDRP